MNVKSNGTTFFMPAAMQLARGEDFARGMRSDVTDYRAMLAREQAKDDEARRVEAEYEAKVEREIREHYEMLDAQDEEEENRRTEAEDAGYYAMYDAVSA